MSLILDPKTVAYHHGRLREAVEEIGPQLLDPVWRINSGLIYQIVTKDERGAQDEEDQEFQPSAVQPFIPNDAQRHLMASLWYRNVILKARQLGFCLDPNTRVLTADLRWVSISDLHAGDELVAVDEQPPGGRGSGRKMRTATVHAAAIVQRDAYRITLDDGREVICTDQHPWLTKTAIKQPRWRSISGKGNAAEGRIKVGTSIRWVTKPWADGDMADGWMGGMLDGEGSMAQAYASGAEINVSQRDGAVWRRLCDYAAERGYSARIEADAAERLNKHGKVPVPKLCFTRMDEMFRLIGQTRPTRFIGRRFWEGKELPGKRNGGVGWATVVEIEHLGLRDMIDLQTSTGTYIAEGFVSHNTTLISILWLDHAMWNANQNVGIIAQTERTASKIFRGKVLFGYEHMPECLRLAFPLKKQSAEELIWAHNGSSYTVAVSVRGETLHRLHISELGAISKESPIKANEAVEGSLPAVSPTGIAVIESTAEGMEGEFYEISTRAQHLDEQLHEHGRPLTRADYRFHFYAWHHHPPYVADPASVSISSGDHAYFDQVEREMKTRLSMEQRAWWVSMRDGWARGRTERMWKQFPSTPAECWQQTTEGVILANELTRARLTHRITKVPLTRGVPVNTFWDIGSRDGCCLWLHQNVGLQHRFLKYIEGQFSGFDTYVGMADAWAAEQGGVVWGRHFLPHDANAVHQEMRRAVSPLTMLEELKPGWEFVIVPRISEWFHGIQKLREAFDTYWFDAEGCKPGLDHMQLYKLKYNKAIGAFTDEPVKLHTEAPDALRQHAQGWTNPTVTAGTVPRRNAVQRRRA